jgi:SpoVK/Ycf46/Vps4 family AAA+-type ATPase
LNNLVGLTNLKDSIFSQVIYYLQDMHKRNNSEEYLHTLLMGKPGCGKTTVAKIIAKIYQNLGVLSVNGPFKVAYRDDFVAGYLGQTAAKTQKLLKSCIGGVLFIDEAYALGAGVNDKDSFSKEAIDTITSFLSEHTKDFCCIAAGYEDDIKKCFLGANSGLESRFQWQHYIDEYTSDNLADIFIKNVKNIRWDLCVSREELINLIEENSKLFSSYGRDIINLISKSKIAHARRVFCLQQKHKFILTKEDILNGIKELEKHKKKDIFEEDIPPIGMYL